MRLSGSIAPLSLALSLSFSFSLTLWHDTEVGAIGWAFRHPHPPHSFSLNLIKLAAGLSTLLGPHLVFDQSVCRMCTNTRSPCQSKLIWSSTIQVTHAEYTCLHIQAHVLVYRQACMMHLNCLTVRNLTFFTAIQTIMPSVLIHYHNIAHQHTFVSCMFRSHTLAICWQPSGLITLPYAISLYDNFHSIQTEW